MWIYEEKEFAELPEGYIGFVYLIHNIDNDKYYIGKKLFTSAKRRTVKGKVKRSRVESDWKDYFGSNKSLLSDVATYGPERFTRTILRLCRTKGECSYFEAKYQFSHGVLENPEKFYNEWIQVKVHRKHLKLGA